MLGFLRGTHKEEDDGPPMEFRQIGPPRQSPVTQRPPGGGAAPPQHTQGKGAAQPTQQARQQPQISQQHVDRLLARVQTSTVAVDRREALDELTSIKNLANHLASDNVAMLMNTMRLHLEDDDTVKATMELFASITEDTVGKSHDAMVRRDAFLHEMMDASTLLTVLRNGTFWPKYHAVQVLTRLNEYDGPVLQQQLSDSDGIIALTDILNDNSNGGALRNEGLILIRALAMTNTHIQTSLTFNNGFESLFGIIKEEGGATGDVIVNDCLTIVQYMLRRNKQTQLFFREMGCASHLNQLLIGHFDGPVPQVSNDIVHSAVCVVADLIRGEDSNGNSVAVRKSLVHSGIPQSLCTVAFSTELNSVAVIEALRTLALLVTNSKQLADALLNINLKIPNVGPVNAIHKLLQMALGDSDNTKQSSAMLCLVNCLEAGGMNAAMFLTRGFAVSKATPRLPGGQQPVQGQQLCGQLLGSTLYGASGRAGNPRCVYNAAWLLHYCVMIPPVADSLLGVAVDEGNTLLPYHVKHVMGVLQGRQTDLSTLSALLRPLFAWLRYSTKAVLIFLNDEQLFNFFAGWSQQTRDPLHIQLLCASVAVVACAMCPEQLPSTVRISRNGLFDLLHTKVGCRRYADLFYNVSTTPEWQHAPTQAVASPSMEIYDKGIISMLSELHDYVQAMLSSMASPTQPDHPPQQETPREPEPTQQQPSRSRTPAATPTTNATDKAYPTSRQASRPQTPQAEAPSADQNQHHSQNGSREPTPAQSTGNAQPDPQLQDMIRQLQQQLEAKAREAEEAKREAQEAAAAREAERNTVRRLEDELAKAQAEADQLKHERSSMMEQSHLLESALSGKDEEARHLAETMAALEARLRESSSGGQEAAELRAQLEQVQAERDELFILVAEMDEEKENLMLQYSDLSTIKKQPREGVESNDTSLAM